MPAPEALTVAREWMTFADEDLVLARAGHTQRQIFQPRQVCFHAQEAAEKAIKALCVLDQIEFPFSHDLVRLTQFLPSPRTLSASVTDLRWLGQWAMATRYPGEVEPDWADARRAVKVADAVVNDARASLPAS